MTIWRASFLYGTCVSLVYFRHRCNDATQRREHGISPSPGGSVEEKGRTHGGSDESAVIY